MITAQNHAGIRFLLFDSTLQRGGTCAAHGIGAQVAILASAKLSWVPPLSDLKVNAPKNASGRAPDSILEAPGLDFGGSGPRFCRFQAPLVERKGFFLTSRGSVMQAFNAWQSPNIHAPNWGGGGGPPWGVFNPPPTVGVATAC